MNANRTPAMLPRDGPTSEEPEIAQEESIPSDGKDEVGEKMMENLGRDRGGPGAEGPAPPPVEPPDVPPEPPAEPMPEQFPVS